MMIKKRGFSLIELLVVISIIGVLSAILMVNFVGTRERARDSQRVQDMNSLKSALRLYYNDNQAYPVGNDINCSLLGISSYFPAIANLACKYTSDGNSFTARIQLESDSGTADTESQANCGLSLGEGFYAVCAK